MGRKSRIKKERKNLKVAEKGVLNISDGELCKNLKGPVYRFFKEKAHAEALCNGYVWLSTLETCRGYENKQQGDRREAIHTCTYDSLTGGSSDVGFVDAASRIGIHIGEGCHDLNFENASGEFILPDALILCTSEEFNPAEMSEDFGNYCVEISNPHEFFKRVSLALDESIGTERGAMAPVQYIGRDYSGFDETPRPIGFVKPKEIYSGQKEVRFIWIPKDKENIKPMMLRCPTVAELCKQIA